MTFAAADRLLTFAFDLDDLELFSAADHGATPVEHLLAARVVVEVA